MSPRWWDFCVLVTVFPLFLSDAGGCHFPHSLIHVKTETSELQWSTAVRPVDTVRVRCHLQLCSVSVHDDCIVCKLPTISTRLGPLCYSGAFFVQAVGWLYRFFSKTECLYELREHNSKRLLLRAFVRNQQSVRGRRHFVTIISLKQTQRETHKDIYTFKFSLSLSL